MESLNSVTPLLYMLSAAGYFTYLFLQKSYLQRIGYVLFFAGFVCHTAMIAYGFVESGHVPVGNLRETLSMAAWAVAGVFLMIQYRFNIKILGIYAAPFIALIMLDKNHLQKCLAHRACRRYFYRRSRLCIGLRHRYSLSSSGKRHQNQTPPIFLQTLTVSGFVG
jgi:hypothetical protein